jgi:carboxyl-terminal processing protease
MKARNVSLAFGLIALSAVGGGIHQFQSRHAASVSAETRRTGRETVEQTFREAQLVVERNYAVDIEAPVGKSGAEKLTVERLTKSGIQGMLRALDPHSNYFDSKEFQELQSEQHSRFYGIGVSIQRRNDRVYVVATIENTPAGRAGLRPGDAIVKVDGENATDWTTAQVLDKVRGPQGEPVEVTIERLGVPKPLTFKIKRDAVPLPSIRTWFMIRPGVGYVALSGGFNHTTEDELRTALEGLKSQGLRALILDLRGNPGGLLTQAIEVSNVFLQRELKILSVKGRSATDESREYRSENSAPFDKPVVALIDRGSASASEIVAGALQDHDRGLVVGERSFGKGLVQKVFPLPFGSGLTLTTAKYYTPSGRCIQRDYNGQSLYAYYAHQGESETPNGAAVATDTGRAVYGGGGISPDVPVKRASLGPVQIRLADAAFDYARHLSAGVVPGLAAYRVERVTYHHELRDTDVPVTDKVVAAFRDFLKANERFKSLEPLVTPNLDYVKAQIREHLATAAYGTEAGFIVHLQTDQQALKAIDSVPQATELAERAQVMRAANPRN